VERSYEVFSVFGLWVLILAGIEGSVIIIMLGFIFRVMKVRRWRS